MYANVKPPRTSHLDLLRQQENVSAMGVTNQEFFTHSMYFSDTVRTQLVNNKHKFINEFLVCQNIGRGSYSKVKKVIRVTDKN
jgi:hypothetical protein